MLCMFTRQFEGADHEYDCIERVLESMSQTEWSQGEIWHIYWTSGYGAYCRWYVWGEAKCTTKEQKAWDSFKAVVSSFLRNFKAPNYKALIMDLLHSYNKRGCQMSLKVHYLHSYLYFFSENMGAINDEQGEHFHQMIQTIKHHSQGYWLSLGLLLAFTEGDKYSS